MKKQFINFGLLSALLMISALVLAGGSGELTVFPEIDQPEDLVFDQQHIYIVQGYRIFIYDRKNFQIKNIFGKTDDQPDAFNPGPNGKFKLKLNAQSDTLIISSHEKISRFSKTGEFIENLKTPYMIQSIVPLGKRYAGSAYYIHRGTGKSTQHIVLATQGLKFDKELAESPLGVGSAKGFGGPDRKLHFDLIPHYFGCKVAGDFLYLADSSKGIYAAVFDLNGEKIKEIKYKSEKIQISEEYRNQRVAELQKTKTFKRHGKFVAIDDNGFFKAFKDFFPVQGKLLFLTYKTREGKNKWISIDQNGAYAGHLWLPGSEILTIYGNQFFYLKKNRYQEWCLFQIDLENLKPKK